MGLSSAMQWWEEWQLRVLVLASLFFQYLLFFSIWVRRVASLAKLRVLVWIAYVGSDALAIYALATLFNRQKQTWDGESSALEVLWAPVLLIHLGGQPWISAYSLEDNELWKRHTITLVAQVTVAVYVFCKWRSGEKTLLAASVLLFVLGTLKFSQKPWALRTASFNTMQASDTVSLLAAAQKEGCMYPLEEYVQAAKKCVLDTKVDSLSEYATQRSYMFVDQSAPYSVRIRELQLFLKLEDNKAYNMLQELVANAFENLYTRLGSIFTNFSFYLMCLFPFLALASMVLFAMSRKDVHKEKDVDVTYILLFCTTLLEFLFPFMGFCTYFPCWDNFLSKHMLGWHDIVSQSNIMSFCVRKVKPTFLMKLVTFNFLREFVNQHWYIQQVPIAYQITGLVRRHVEDGWKMHIHEVASYRRFSEFRGQLAVMSNDQLRWSLKMPFDESVLIWHIATDLCFYQPKTTLQCQDVEAIERSSREISNYMIYLLLIRTEMLMPGSRSDFFTLASREIVESIKGTIDMTEEILAREILEKQMLLPSDGIIANSCKLAGALMLLDEKVRWSVVQGVWVEMICYSANRCRGYLHAKSLADGGECLTTIGLLWAAMGMETLADRHHRSEPHEAAGETKAAASAGGGAGSQGRVSQSAEDDSPV